MLVVPVLHAFLCAATITTTAALTGTTGDPAPAPMPPAMTVSTITGPRVDTTGLHPNALAVAAPADQPTGVPPVPYPVAHPALTPSASTASTASVHPAGPASSADAAGVEGGDASARRYRPTGVAATAVGQLLSPTGSCTATVIAARIAITAAHCVVHPNRPDPTTPTTPDTTAPEKTTSPGTSTSPASPRTATSTPEPTPAPTPNPTPSATPDPTDDPAPEVPAGPTSTSVPTPAPDQPGRAAADTSAPGATDKPTWITGLRFYPGGAHAHRRSWTVTRVWVDRAYLTTADPRTDIAFVQLADHDGHTAASILGTEPIRFTTDDNLTTTSSDSTAPTTTTPDPTAPTTDPAAPTTDSTATAPTSSTPSTPEPTSAPDPGADAGRPDGSPADAGQADLDQADVGQPVTVLGFPVDPPFSGSSGGPWLTGFDPARGTGTVVAVTNVQPFAAPADIAGAHLDTRAHALLRAAEAAGDPTPDDPNSADPAGPSTGAAPSTSTAAPVPTSDPTSTPDPSALPAAPGTPSTPGRGDPPDTTEPSNSSTGADTAPVPDSPGVAVSTVVIVGALPAASPAAHQVARP